MNEVNLLTPIYVLTPQGNLFPDRHTVFDFAFLKKGTGSWIDWMDTIDKSTIAIPPGAKVGLLVSCYIVYQVSYYPIYQPSINATV